MNLKEYFELKCHYGYPRTVKEVFQTEEMPVTVHANFMLVVRNGHLFLEIPLVLAHPQSQGGFSCFFDKLVTLLPEKYCGVYIEGVHSDKLDKWCVKNKLTQDPLDKISYYMLFCREGEKCKYQS